MIQQLIYKGTAQGYQTVAASDGLRNSSLLRRLEMLCRTPGVTWMRQEKPCPIYSRCALDDGIAVGMSVKDLHDNRNRGLSHMLFIPREELSAFSARMLDPDIFRAEYLEKSGGSLQELDVKQKLREPQLSAFPDAARELFGDSAELLASFLAVVQLCRARPNQRPFYGVCVYLPELDERRSLDAYLLMETILRVYRGAGVQSIGYRTLWNGPENNIQYPIFFTAPRYIEDVSSLMNMRYVVLDVASGEVHLPKQMRLEPNEADVELAAAMLDGDAERIAAAIRRARSYEKEQRERAEMKRRQEEEARKRAEEARKREEELARQRAEEARKQAEEKKRREEEARRQREEEARKREEELARQRAEEARRQAEEKKRRVEEARRLREEEARKREEELARQRAEEARKQAEEKKRREEEARRQAEEKKRREEEAHRQQEEAARKQAEEKRQREEEARKQREEAARKKAEEKQRRDEEVRRQQEEAARKKAEEKQRREEEARRQQEEAARKQAEEKRQREEEARKQREEAARKQAEEKRQREEKARRQQEEAARKQAEEKRQREEKARRQQEEAARKQAEEKRQREEKARRQQEEAARKQAEEKQRREEEARRQQGEAARKKAEEKQRREEEARRQQEEARRRREEEARRRQEEATRKQAEEKRRREETERQREAQRKREEEEKKQRIAKRQYEDQAQIEAALRTVDKLKQRKPLAASMDAYDVPNAPVGGRSRQQRSPKHAAGISESQWEDIQRAVFQNRWRITRDGLRSDLRAIAREKGKYEQLCMADFLLRKITETILDLPDKKAEYEPDFMRLALCIFETVLDNLFLTDRFEEAGHSGRLGDDAQIRADHCIWYMLLLSACVGYVPPTGDKQIAHEMDIYQKKDLVELPPEIWKDFAYWRIIASAYRGSYEDLRVCDGVLASFTDQRGKKGLWEVQDRIVDRALWHIKRYPDTQSAHYRAAIILSYCGFCYPYQKPIVIPDVLNEYFRTDPDAWDNITRTLRGILNERYG